ncbi:ALP1-like protein [Tanacetum coccineum]
MNSYTFMGLDDVEEGEEISSRKKTFIKRVIAYIKTRRQATQEDFYFRITFRMARLLFNQIVNAVTAHSAYFQCNPDCAGREGISPLIKCTSTIPVMEIYGPEFLRKPTVTDVEKLYRHHEETHGFPGMLGSLRFVYRDGSGSGCPYALKATCGYCNAILWLLLVEQLHATFCINPPNINDLKTGRAPEIPFVANGVTYPSGYYLVDGIYPELAPLVKTIPEPSNDDHKRILFKQKQESTRKDVERVFGVLKKKWAILANPARALRKDRIVSMMYTCIILHNMIRKYKNYAISPRWFPEEAHQPDDPLRNEEQVQRVMRWIKSSQAHQNLRHDLIEHLAQNA